MQRQYRAHAFTLVELLVVVGIIAVLVSILLPALTRAKESANRVACLSNQKQIYLALSMYCGNSKDWLPPAIGNPLRPSRIDFTEIGQRSPLGTLWFFGYLTGPSTQTTGANPTYYPQVGVYYCPGRYDMFGQPRANGTFASMQVTYFNSSISQTPRMLTPFIDKDGKMFKFNSTKPLVMDNLYESSTPSIAYGTAGSLANLHGQKGINVVYGDGHGIWLPLPERHLIFHSQSGPTSFENFLKPYVYSK